VFLPPPVPVRLSVITCGSGFGGWVRRAGPPDVLVSLRSGRRLVARIRSLVTMLVMRQLRDCVNWRLKWRSISSKVARGERLRRKGK